MRFAGGNVFIARLEAARRNKHQSSFLERTMRIHPALAAAMAAAISMPAGAIDSSYSGFATLGYAQTDTDDALVGYTGQPDGIDSHGSFETDSKIGFQFTSTFNSMFSATVQAIAYSDLTAKWEPRLDWAYVSMKPVQSVRVRAGYLRTPTFMFSDSVFIGYANIWVRPPLEVYNQLAAYQLLGVDATWSDNFGPVGVSLQAFYGNAETKVGDPEVEVDSDDWMGLVASAQYQSFSGRIAYSQFKFSGAFASVRPLEAGLRAVPRAFCGACAGFADALSLDGKELNSFDVGAQYDNGQEVVIAEYARIRAQWSVVADSHGMYLTLGRRFGSFMPYATYAKNVIDSPRSTAAIPIPQLAAAVNTILAGRSDQDSYSAGLSYQAPPLPVLKGAVVKLQYDHIDTDEGNGMLNNVQPGFDGKVEMVSLSFDVLF
jgi:hypothetical protein